MADPFDSVTDSISAPSSHAVGVTPNDGADLPNIPKALYVGVAGDLTAIGLNAPAGATGVLFKAVPAGTLLPFRARRVLATGTTATNILALS